MDVNHYNDVKINTQGGVTYLCNRNTGQPVYNALAELKANT